MVNALYPPFPLIERFLSVANFIAGHQQKIPGPLISPELYFSPQQLIVPGQRAASFFPFAAETAVGGGKPRSGSETLWDRYYAKVGPALANGRVAEVIDESERWRKRLGVATLINAVKR